MWKSKGSDKLAERRMFAKTIIDSDSFLDMPLSTQALYFHLSMRADDDGFVNNPIKIMRMINASRNDMDLLCAKQFVIAFESGIIVIKHWKIHNYIQKDRYRPTQYIDEKSQLTISSNKMYELNVPESDTECIQDVSEMETSCTPRLGKDRLGKDRLGNIEESKEKTPDKPAHTKKDIPPTIEEVKAYCAERKKGVDPKRWYNHYQANGWMVGKTKMKDWKAAVRTWERDDYNAGRTTNGKGNNEPHSGERKEKVPKYGEVL